MNTYENRKCNHLSEFPKWTFNATHLSYECTYVYPYLLRAFYATGPWPLFVFEKGLLLDHVFHSRSVSPFLNTLITIYFILISAQILKTSRPFQTVLRLDEQCTVRIDKVLLLRRKR